MLTFFTDPYPRELFYSICARYHFYSGNVGYSTTLAELLGDERFNLTNILFCRNLEYLCNNLSAYYQPTMFIQKHTVFPYYAPFLPVQRYNAAFQGILNSAGVSVLDKLGINEHGLCKKEAFCFCCECVKQDVEIYGEPYIHSEHQLEGVFICPLHGKKLYTRAVKNVHLPPNKFYRLTEEDLVSGQVVAFPEKYYSLLKKISQAAYFLLNLKISTLNLEQISAKYRTKLDSRGYLTLKKIIRKKKLDVDFVAYYGAEVLDFFKADLNSKKDGNNWLTDIAGQFPKIVHPLKHILFIFFLFGEIENFFADNSGPYHVFGKAPWPCLNKVAEHYRKDVVTEVTVNYDRRTRLFRGCFYCSCGFTYFRKSPELNNDDRFSYSSVKNYGHVWFDKLQGYLAKNKYSRRELARLMLCDVDTIKNYTHPKNKSDGNEHQLLYKKLQEVKERLHSALQQKPLISRSGFKKMFSNELYLIQKYDNQWLKITLASAYKTDTVRKSFAMLDWGARDVELLEQVKRAHVIILNSSKPLRISITAISRLIKPKSLLVHSLSKLPITEQYLSAILESYDEFYLRKISMQIIRLRQENLPITKWALISSSGVSAEKYMLLKEKIDALLEVGNRSLT